MGTTPTVSSQSEVRGTDWLTGHLTHSPVTPSLPTLGVGLLRSGVVPPVKRGEVGFPGQPQPHHCHQLFHPECDRECSELRGGGSSGVGEATCRRVRGVGRGGLDGEGTGRDDRWVLQDTLSKGGEDRG